MVELKNKDDLWDYKKCDVVLLDFYADWCGPCKSMVPVLEKLEKNIDIKIVKVNVDNHRDLAKEYKVMTIPNLKLLKYGEVVWEHSGFISYDDFVKVIGDDE